MPRTVDEIDRGRQIEAATMRTIARHGVAGVTIRRVAAELGRSTTTITHYVDNRDELLELAVGNALRARQEELERLLVETADPLWTLVEWSVQLDEVEVWRALAAATAADVDPVVSQLVRAFERWWSDLTATVVDGRLRPGLSVETAVEAIGVVVDGLVLAVDGDGWTDPDRRRLARLLVTPLLDPSPQPRNDETPGQRPGVSTGGP